MTEPRRGRKKKKKASRDAAADAADHPRERACVRAYPARAVAENYFSAASAGAPAGNSHRICEYRMRVPFADGRYRLIFLPMSRRSAYGAEYGIRAAFLFN